MGVHRTVRRVAGLLGATVVSVAVGPAIQRRYRSDIRDAYAAVDGADTESVETSLGTVEFRRYETGVHLVFGHGNEIRRAVSEFAISR